ncbi:hypothetical protein NC651_040158 [Populus alba x Populus x berolinensis]|nr:hypothetical protein NC651_040158 [Populus alba x Populus x berolinensis]
MPKNQTAPFWMLLFTICWLKTDSAGEKNPADSTGKIPANHGHYTEIPGLHDAGS